jgi:hypothetical protein
MEQRIPDQPFAKWAPVLVALRTVLADRLPAWREKSVNIDHGTHGGNFDALVWQITDGTRAYTRTAGGSPATSMEQTAMRACWDFARDIDGGMFEGPMRGSDRNP